MISEATKRHLDTIDNIVLLEPRSTYDRALVGVASRLDANQGSELFSVYSNKAIVEALMEVEGLSKEDAIEYLVYNVLGLQLGNETPAFIADM